MKTISLLFSLLLATTPITAQFQICPSPTTKNLKDVYFINADVGIAVGDSGVVIRTIDGGLNWTLIMETDTASFTKVKFFDTQNGIAIGSHIFRTTDAGQTWINVPHTNTQFMDVEILNSTTCIIAGTPTALIKSEDLGQNWTVLVEEQLDERYGLLSFIDENMGYACGYWGSYSTHTMKTTDGGNTWIRIEAPETQITPTVMEGISFISEDVGFKAGWYNGHLQKTVNGANDWAYVGVPTPYFDMQLLDIHIEANQPNAYYASGWYGKIYKSTDGGNNWIELNSGLPTDVSLYGIYFIDDNNGWVVGAYGTILKTSNGGTVGLNEPQNHPEISLYPNPVHDVLHIENTGNQDVVQIELRGINGQLIETYSKATTLNLGHLPVGIYFLQLELSDGVQVKRLFTKM